MATKVTFKFAPQDEVYFIFANKLQRGVVYRVEYDDVNNIQLYSINTLRGVAFESKDLYGTCEEAAKSLCKNFKK